MNTQNETNRIVLLLKRMGINVVFNKQANNAFFPDSNEITINSRAKSNLQLIYLIHETGHFLMTRKKEFDWLLHVVEYKNERTNLYKITKIEEEITAWNIGKMFANKNNISFDEKEFDEVKARCVATYARSFYAR